MKNVGFFPVCQHERRFLGHEVATIVVTGRSHRCYHHLRPPIAAGDSRLNDDSLERRLTPPSGERSTGPRGGHPFHGVLRKSCLVHPAMRKEGSLVHPGSPQALLQTSAIPFRARLAQQTSACLLPATANDGLFEQPALTQLLLPTWNMPSVLGANALLIVPTTHCGGCLMQSRCPHALLNAGSHHALSGVAKLELFLSLPGRTTDTGPWCIPRVLMACS